MFDFDWQRFTQNRQLTTFTTIDAHTAGEPLRILIDPLELPGESILQRRAAMQASFDQVRRLLMHEPRGHFNMYGAVLTPPVDPDADIGVLFLHNEGYSTMCGHGIIALGTVLLECGVIEARPPATSYTFETPAGLVHAVVHQDQEQRVTHVSFENVASFVLHRDLELQLNSISQSVRCDVAFGGAFYAIIPVSELGVRVSEDNLPTLVQLADEIKQAVSAQTTLHHPSHRELEFLYGVIFTDDPQDPAHHSRNVCVFADREVDRSPTGTGVSARLALHYARHEITTESISIESILGADSVFRGRVVRNLRVGEFEAIVPEVTGNAFITGKHTFCLDQADVFPNGFLI